MTKERLETFCKISIISIAVVLSNDPVGSSAKMILGPLINALAIATLCFSPPDNLDTLCLTFFFNPTMAITSKHFCIFLSLLAVEIASKGKMMLLKTLSSSNNLKS